MSTVLHLGVSDVPYTGPAPEKTEAKGPTATTGDVAEILETKYGIMRFFFAAHEADIAKDLEGSIAGALESILMGAPPDVSAFGEATSAIEARFKDFLTNKEMDGQVGGVPTRASLMGVSHRFKGKRGAAGRPSFIDTGLFESSFKTWMDR